MKGRVLGMGLAALAWMLVVAAQAPAISRGVPDGEGHPMVAALGGTTPEGVFRYCGAVLVSETVLVTAAHCVAPGARPPGVELRVNFGTNAASNDPGWFTPVAEVASPQFRTGFGRRSHQPSNVHGKTPNRKMKLLNNTYRNAPRECATTYRNNRRMFVRLICVAFVQS